jgi:ribonucleotide monophosphatase NagD (HAD superfamily)
MGRLGDPCYAELAGIRVTRRLEELAGCRAVIVGEDAYDWEPVVNGVINFLIAHPEAPFVVPNPDLYYPAENRRIHVSAGGVAGLVAAVCGAQRASGRAGFSRKTARADFPPQPPSVGAGLRAANRAPTRDDGR